LISAFCVTIANLLVSLSSSFTSILAFRFLTGVFLAGVYPTSMKIVSTWFERKRGFAMGILLAALTLGSGAPYLFNLTFVQNWKILMNISTALSFTGTILILLFVKEGPLHKGTSKFSFKNIKNVILNKSSRYANYGYFGHMWELYAMWTWLPLMLRTSYELANPGKDPTVYFSLGAFAIFFLGGIGTAFGGKLADKYGRTKFNIIMLTVSGISSIVIGLVFFNPTLVIIVALIWGLTVIPDSPQYSSMITELSEKKLLGTALTLQTSIGFLITLISIYLIPIVQKAVGWNFTFMILTIGPILGIISLLKLRSFPESRKIAHGKK